jgi:hypothetical protein
MRHVTEPHRREVAGGKGFVFYHSYHTKAPPEGIVPMIEHYTHPGDFILDPFCGSRMTGGVRGHEEAHAPLTTCDGLRLPRCRLRGSLADGLAIGGGR